VLPVELEPLPEPLVDPVDEPLLLLLLLFSDAIFLAFNLAAAALLPAAIASASVSAPVFFVLTIASA
jgi:hypothetical protein